MGEMRLTVPVRSWHVIHDCQVGTVLERDLFRLFMYVPVHFM